jgi:hypothetical protein
MQDHPKPPFPNQRQSMPGSTARMDPRPDHGETSKPVDPVYAIVASASAGPDKFVVCMAVGAALMLACVGNFRICRPGRTGYMLPIA